MLKLSPCIAKKCGVMTPQDRYGVSQTSTVTIRKPNSSVIPMVDLSGIWMVAWKPDWKKPVHDPKCQVFKWSTKSRDFTNWIPDTHTFPYLDESGIQVLGIQIVTVDMFASKITEGSNHYEISGRMLKAPPLKSSYLHLSVIKCNCRTYEKNELCYFGGVQYVRQ